MAIAWTEAMFRKWYALPTATGATTTYSRVGWRYYRGPEPGWNYLAGAQYPDHPLNEYRYRVERLIANLGIGLLDRILVLGCGSGFLPEAFIWWKQQQGLVLATAQSHVAGVDNSQFVQGNISSEAHPVMQGKVINRSLLLGAANAQMRGSLRNAAGGLEFFDWVITESVVESYTDAERPAFMTAVESYQRNAPYLSGSPRNIARCVHIVFPAREDGTGWDPVPDGGAPNRLLHEWAATRPQHSWVNAEGAMPSIAGTG